MTTAELFDLTDKVALVTGSTKGLGRSMAKGLAQASRVLALDRESARLEGQRGPLDAGVLPQRGAECRARRSDRSSVFPTPAKLSCCVPPPGTHTSIE